MNRKVFLSILAMDSYQRGYAPGINLGPASDAIGRKIGTAEIVNRATSDSAAASVQAGFYAVAYQWGGETVISYRGTDFDIGNGGKILDGQFVRDLWGGWSTFTGLGSRSQFGFAEAFFTSVTGGQFYDGVTYSNVTVTGHSLGGALAGYVDAAVDVSSYLVDPIPYGVTAWLNAISDAFAATLMEFGNLTLADFETLDEVNSTDDSRFRAELLTPAQFHFATSLGRIDFRPEMLTASRRKAAANDNEQRVWREAVFRCGDGRIAA